MSVLDPQQSLAQPVTLSGISLMLGLPSTLILRPAPAETGIVFIRADMPDRPEIRVEVSDKVTDLGRCTGIRNAHVSLQTIEHILSALAGLRIDNVVIEVTAPEPPILDGSSKPFVDAIRAAGIVQQDAPRRYLELDAPMSVEHENKQVVLVPADSFRVTFVFDKFDHPGIETQVATFDLTPEVYERDIAPARTFCFEDEVDALLAAGLGRGANAENVLIIGKNGQPKENGYRFVDELVRHKILDLIGDLYLTGRLPKAHVLALRSQHALNLRLVQEIFDRQQENRTQEQYLLNPPMSAQEIESILPHRYPFLLVDRVLEIEEGKRIVGIKNVTYNEEFFRGHFPGHPVMPAVLISEAMAQTAGVLVLRSPDVAGKLAYFMTIENAKFRRPVVPGDQLRMEVELLRLRHRVGKLRGVATVDGQMAAEAEFSFIIVERDAE